MEASQPVPAPGAERVTFRFTGRAGEYFLIWIVNICLSVITLGIYSAWAKVRRKRYFYGNTYLHDSSFDYLASPKSILYGRILVVAVFAVYSAAEKLLPPLAIALFLGMLALSPWIIKMALRFNSRNSAHRNVRFGFHGTYGGIVVSMGLPLLLTMVTLGLAFPFFLQRRDKYLLNQTAYGGTRFAFHATVGDYYLASLKIFLAGIGFLLGSIVSIGILALPLYILVRSYAIAVMARLMWSNTTLGGLRLSCEWSAWGLFKLYAVNALGILVSFGLLVPWAAIRAARYKLERLSLEPAGAIGGFITAAEGQVAAIGEEAGELIGLDIGL